jgi:hypothetical protein
MTTLIRSLTALLLLLVALAPALADEALTNASIIEMVELGLGESIILKKIETSPTHFDTDLGALKQLKEAGVSDAVISAMLSAAERAEEARGGLPAWAPERPGVYFATDRTDEPGLERIESSSFSIKQGRGIKTRFIGTAKTKTKVRLAGPSSATTLASNPPVFYFLLETPGDESSAPTGDSQIAQARAMMQQMQGGGEASSPKDYVLVRLDVDKQTREFVAASYNLYSSSSGVNEESVVQFDHEEIAPDFFRVEPRGSLAPGEYCFYRPTPNPQASAGHNLVFDFSVR